MTLRDHAHVAELGEPAPSGPAALLSLTIVTRPTIRVDFHSGGGGKPAVYMLGYVNMQGERGPWSEVASAKVAA